MEGKRAGGRSEGPRGGRGQPPMDESGLLLTCGLDDEDEEKEVDGEESEAEAKLLVGACGGRLGDDITVVDVHITSCGKSGL